MVTDGVPMSGWVAAGNTVSGTNGRTKIAYLCKHTERIPSDFQAGLGRTGLGVNHSHRGPPPAKARAELGNRGLLQRFGWAELLDSASRAVAQH